MMVSATCFIFFGASFFMTFSESVLFIFFWLLSVYLFYGLGYVLVLLFKSSRSTNIASTALFLIMIFGSGIAIPLDSLPEVVRKVADLTPMAHAIKLLDALWVGKPIFEDNLFNIGYLVGVSVLLTIIISTYKVKWEA